MPRAKRKADRSNGERLNSSTEVRRRFRPRASSCRPFPIQSHGCRTSRIAFCGVGFQAFDNSGTFDERGRGPGNGLFIRYFSNGVFPHMLILPPPYFMETKIWYYPDPDEAHQRSSEYASFIPPRKPDGYLEWNLVRLFAFCRTLGAHPLIL